MSNPNDAGVQDLPGRQQLPLGTEMTVRQASQSDLIAAFSQNTLKESHTFAGSPEQVWRYVSLASMPDVQDLSAIGEQSIELVDWYIHEADLRADKDGQIPRVIRTVLYDSDGKRYQTTSEGIARDVYRLMTIFGQRHYNPPVLVKMVRVKTGSGFYIMRLMPA